MRRKSSRLQLFFKMGVSLNISQYSQKNMCWNFLLISETPTQVFSCEYCESFKSSFLHRIVVVATSGDISKTVKSDGMKINYLNPSFVNGCNA